MATINYKLINQCAGGDHAQLDLTPGPTFPLAVGEFRDRISTVAAMENKEKALWLLALHANANNLTLAQLKAELVAASGLDLTI